MLLLLPLLLSLLWLLLSLLHPQRQFIRAQDHLIEISKSLPTNLCADCAPPCIALSCAMFSGIGLKSVLCFCDAFKRNK